MIGTIFDWFRYVGEKIQCKNCDYETLFAFRMVKHLKRQHNVKTTKKDLRFLLKYNFVSRVVKVFIGAILIVPLIILKLICAFFIWLDDLI